MKISKLLSCIIIFFLPFSTFAQMYFANPSFEGPTGTGITGAPWGICCGTPDTGPGPFGVTIPPSNGSSYVCFWDGGPLLGSCTGGNGEGASEQLPCALRAGKQYTFTLDIAWDLHSGVTYTQGAVLEIYGGMANCAKTSLLWSGSPTAANVWQTKTVTFTPTSNWTYISFFAKSGSGNKYVLLDNLSAISRAPAAVASVNASCGGPGNDGSATVTPPADGTAWQFLWSNGQTTATATNLAPGSYTCTIKDPSEACPVPIYVTVFIQGPPPVTISASPTSVCLGQTSQLQAAVPPPVIPSCIYAINMFDSFGDGWSTPGKVKVYVNGVLVGTYTLAGGSASSATFSVTHGDNIQVVYTSSTSYNNENSYEIRDATSAVVYSSGTNPANNSGWTGTANCGYTPPVYTYTWTPAATLNNASIYNPVATPTTTTTYTVNVVSSTNPGCASIKTVTVTVNGSSPTAVNANRCGTGTVNLSATGCAGTINWYTASTGGASISTSNPFTTPSISSTTTYYATCTVSGCESARIPVIATINPLPNVNAGLDQVITCTSASVILNGSSSTGGATFSWAGPGIVSGGTTATPTVNAAGTYTLTVTAGGCSATDQAVVTTNTTLPNANAGIDKTLTCTVTSIALSGSSTTGGVTYNWAGPGIASGGTTATPTVNAAGTYTITVTDPTNGCTATDMAVINSNTTPPNANAGIDKTLTCTVTSIALSGSSTTGGVTYSWAGPGIVSGGATATPTVNVTGSYTVTVTDPTNGCTATDIAIINSNTTPPNANAGIDKTLTCTATSLVLSGSSATGGVTFSWAGPGIVSGGATATPTVNAAGTYTVTVTNPVNGCTATDQTIINSNTTPPNANAGLDKTLTCASPSATLNGSSTTGGVTYSWAGPSSYSSTSQSPTVSIAGTYTLTVTDPTNGCTATDQVSVTPSAGLPNVSAGADQTLTCTVISVALNGSSTTPGATFSWAGPGIVSGGTTATPTVNAAGTYTLTITDPGNGCTSTDQAVVINNSTPPNTNAGADTTLTCTTTSLILNGSSTTAGVTFSWAGPGIVSGGTTATPTVNAAGTYTLTVTNPANNCTAVDQVVVSNSSALPDANAGTDQTLTCIATSLTLNGSSTTAGATFSWSGPGIVSGGTTATPTINAAGTYTLTVTNPANGCTATDQVVVSNSSALPNVNAGADEILTCIVTSVTLNGSSTTGGATFSWAGPGIVSGGTTATPTVNSAGTYTLTVTNPANGCTATDQAVVTPSAGLPNVDAGADQTLTCAVTSILLNGSSTTASATFSWSGPGIVSGGTTATPSINAAGTYTLTVTDPANGCSSTDQAVVNTNTTPPNVNAGNDTTLTCTVTSVTLNGSSTTAGATYSWSGPAVVSGGTTLTPTVNGAGTYILTVTDPVNGCTATDQATVNSSAGLPTANAGTDQTLTCTVTTVSLDGTASTSGLTYTWAGAGIVSGSGTPTATVNGAGTFTLTVTNSANGCTATDQVVVNSNTTAPDVNAGADQMLTCAAPSVVLNGSSTTVGATYSWNGPAIVSGGTTLTPTVNGAGTYTLTVTDPVNGCIAVDQADVTPSVGLPNVNAGADQTLTCAVTSLVLNGSSSTAGATFNWSGAGIVSGGTTTSPTVNTAGTYTLTVTDPANGCSAADQVIINTNTTAPAADAGANQTITCSVTSVTLDGSLSSAGMTYSWSGPGGFTSGTQSTTASTAGTYTLTVTDPANGCVSTASVTVTPSAGLPNVNAGPDQTLTCSITSVTLNGSSSTAGVTYSWSGTSGVIAGTPTTSVSSAGTYSLTVTDPSNGCSATDLVTISSNTTPPTANAGADQTITCTITSVTLDGSLSSAGMNYSWSGPGGFTASTQITSTTNAGGYVLTVSDPSNGCFASDQVEVGLAAGVPTANAGPDQLLTCAVTSVNLDGSLSSAGMTYSWTGPGGFVSSIQSPAATVAGTYSLTVTNSANGCSSTAQVQVNSNTVVPAADASTTNASICVGKNTTLNAAPVGTNYTYVWSLGTGLSSTSTANPIATPTATTDYTVTVTDSNNGCSASDNVSVIVSALPNPVFSSSATTGCAPLCVTFTDHSTVTSGSVTGWSWNFNDGSGTGANPSHCFVNPGTYSVVLTDTSNAGCIATSVIPYVITVNPNPVANFTAPLSTSILTPTVAYSDESTIAAPGIITSWNWNFGDLQDLPNNTSTQQNPSHTFSDLGTYCAQLIVTSNAGCKDTVPYCIVIDPEFSFFIPNAFSPNDDGVNDEFYGKGDYINSYEMLIYDRWGNMIFYTNDITKHWKGEANGGSEVAPEDIYVYVVKLTDNKDKKHKFIGTVTVVK